MPETPPNLIRVRGARVHNLRSVDVDLPLGQIVALTGVSGSGKSSLAFDTLFAEGRRRYLEGLSFSRRKLLDQLPRPDVDQIEGLPPTLCVEQLSGARQQRSTVATVTEIYDFLRLLYARTGRPHCPDCGTEIAQQSPQAIVDRILALEAGRKVMLLAPKVRGKRGAHTAVFEEIAKAGFVRARVDGEIVDVATPPALAKTRQHTIEAVVDRVVVKEGLRARVQESVNLTLKQGDGVCIVSQLAGAEWEDHLYSSRYTCPNCGLSLAEVEPRTFSFNSPYGACPTCEGLGTAADNEDLPCPDCHGSRLGPVGRNVTVAGMTLPALTALTLGPALDWLQERAAEALLNSLAMTFSPTEKLVAQRVLSELLPRLDYLRRVGLDYLSLDRSAASLSGGEFQRTRLAASLGSGLVGVCYILDEPTVGLHPRDSDRLWEALHSLREQGNSVLLVEHDLDLIRRADYVVDLGPGAGKEGGRLLAAGTPAEIAIVPESITGGFLAGRLRVAEERGPRSISPERRLILSGATRHNLQSVTAEIPLGLLTCVTGVSGSGKSTLITECLLPLLRRAIAGAPPDDTRGRLEHAELVTRVLEIDQTPLGRSGRSNPATYSGIWDPIRRLFAKTREARLRGFTARRFSFQSPEGRCPACRGQGTRRLEMPLLPGLEIICSACRGSRFNPATLAVRFRGKSIADLLEMTIAEAAGFLGTVPKVAPVLQTFVDVGLGHLALGQPASTLSGGEAQRVKLATELGQAVQAGTLYLLDEPTTGLHPADVGRLVRILHRLVDQGNTVLVIEHHLELIAAADWVIDMGPDAGAGGGRIVGTGTPAELARLETPTGRALAHSFSV